MYVFNRRKRDRLIIIAIPVEDASFDSFVSDLEKAPYFIIAYIRGKRLEDFKVIPRTMIRKENAIEVINFLERYNIRYILAPPPSMRIVEYLYASGISLIQAERGLPVIEILKEKGLIEETLYPPEEISKIISVKPTVDESLKGSINDFKQKVSRAEKKSNRVWLSSTATSFAFLLIGALAPPSSPLRGFSMLGFILLFLGGIIVSANIYNRQVDWVFKERFNVPGNVSLEKISKLLANQLSKYGFLKASLRPSKDKIDAFISVKASYSEEGIIKEEILPVRLTITREGERTISVNIVSSIKPSLAKIVEKELIRANTVIIDALHKLEEAFVEEQQRLAISTMVFGDFRSFNRFLEEKGVFVGAVKCPQCRETIYLPREGYTARCWRCGRNFSPRDIFSIIVENIREAEKEAKLTTI
ncbi:MAG: hypothetical protein DRJ47_02370 [Thermoprotei archaeon]|nr:MAG: hypothetical protein DRJ47_02370 [Thermoprotei archaeon]